MHASHRVERLQCSMPCRLQVSTIVHSTPSVNQSIKFLSSQPQPSHPSLAQVLTPTHFAAEPIVLLLQRQTHLLRFLFTSREFVGGSALTRASPSLHALHLHSTPDDRCRRVCATCWPATRRRMIVCHARRDERLAGLPTCRLVGVRWPYLNP